MAKPQQYLSFCVILAAGICSMILINPDPLVQQRKIIVLPGIHNPRFSEPLNPGTNIGFGQSAEAEQYG